MTKPPVPRNCAQMLIGNAGELTRKCCTPSAIHEDGQEWCAQHAPSRVRARDAMLKERWRRKAAIDFARTGVEHCELIVIESAESWHRDPTQESTGVLIEACRDLAVARERMRVLAGEHLAIAKAESS